MRAVIVWIAALLPALGLIAAAFLGRNSDRERIDVQFVGYRIPMTRILKCGTLGKNIATARGVWIGGGRRWPEDSADVISLPGYRGRLAEICRANDELVVRQVRPGETWYQLPSQKWGLQDTNDIDTQHLLLRGPADTVERSCITFKGATVSTSAIIEFAKRERAGAIRKTPASGVRAGLLKRFRGWPEDDQVACVDIGSGKPKACAADLTSSVAPVFAWPTERMVTGGWDFVPPRGAVWDDCGGKNGIAPDQAVTLKLKQLARGARWSAWKDAAAGVTLRMVTRRTVGGVADQSVALPTDVFEPLPLRLGTRYELGFAQLGPDLVVVHEDPSVQLRIPDLYGGAPMEVKEGEFELTFNSPPGEELLVIDLSSRADHLAPKAIFEHVQARVTVPQEGQEFSVTAQGRPAEKRRFNEVFALDVSRDPSAIRPLLLIRRVSPPMTAFVLPLVAALMLIGATLMDRSSYPLLDARWLFAALLLALLDLRFAMSTRWLLNEYSSPEALRNWVVNGAYLLIGPPFALLIATLLRRGRAIVTAAKSSKDLYTLPTSASSAAPSSGAATPRTRWSDRPRKFLSAVVARFRERDLLPLAQWNCIAIASTAVWILFAGGETPDAGAAVRKLLPTLFIAAIATAAAWGAYRLASNWVERGRGTEDPFQFKKKKAERPKMGFFARAAVVGVLFLLIRALTYFTGSQEQLGGIRVDVFALPLSAAILAAFTRPSELGRAAWGRFLALGLLFVILFGLAGGMMNDFGLVWVGGMAFVLALPAATGNRPYAYAASLAIFFLLFISPRVAPSPFREAMRLLAGNRQEIASAAGTVKITDDLQVSRDRDYYRLIDANQPEAVTAIPSQLAREVVIERERVRYQSLDGAWREAFRSESSPHSPWTGAGFLRGRAVIGDPTFTRAARSDYVFPTYLRAEFGSLGLLAAVTLYVAMFVCGALGTIDRLRALPVALWSMAMAAGTGLFMLGGTSGIFPFSGKWPLLLSFASNSDAALGLALIVLALVERE